MALADAFTNMSPREKRLLSLLGAVAAVLVFVGLPFYFYSELSATKAKNEEIRKLLRRIDRAGPLLVERRGEREARSLRFNKPAPPLATFIEKQAQAYGLDVPEAKDLAELDVAGYKQRTTVVKLRKVGLRPLVNMLEKIERSGHPVAITQLVINAKASQPDMYDVTLAISAYDKPKASAKPGDGKKPAAKGKAAPKKGGN